MDEIVTMVLNGGPHDGEKIEIHRDNLKIKPIMNVCDENNNWSSYAINDDGNYTWLSSPDDPSNIHKFYVCADDGTVISQEVSEEDALEMLDKYNDKASYH